MLNSCRSFVSNGCTSRNLPKLRPDRSVVSKSQLDEIQFSFNLEKKLVKKISALIVIAFLCVTAAFGQAELEKYVGQYQVTGAPVMVTVRLASGKLSVA